MNSGNHLKTSFKSVTQITRLSGCQWRAQSTSACDQHPGKAATQIKLPQLSLNLNLSLHEDSPGNWKGLQASVQGQREHQENELLFLRLYISPDK